MATSFFNNNCADDAEEIESAKNYADLAKDWAIKLDGQVDGIDFSAKYWAQQAAESGAAQIAIEDDGVPLGSEFNVLNFGVGISVLQTAANEVQIQASGDVFTEIFTDGVDYTAGSSTDIVLSEDPVSEKNIGIYFDGIRQQTDTYDVSGTMVTFTTAIPVGVGSIEVVRPRTLDVGVASAQNITYGVAGVTADNFFDQSLVTFDTVADFQAATWLQVGMRCRWLGYNSVGDGGGNEGVVVASGTATADGGSYFDMSGSGHQMQATFPGGQIFAKQFGVVADDSTDDLAAGQAAVAYVKSLGGGKLFWPVGSIALSAPLVVDCSAIEMIGGGTAGTFFNNDTGQPRGTLFRYTGAGSEPTIDLGNGTNLYTGILLRDFGIDCKGAASSIALRLNSGIINSEFNNINFYNTAKGSEILGSGLITSFNNKYVNCTFEHFDDFGLDVFQDGNGTIVEGCKFINSAALGPTPQACIRVGEDDLCNSIVIKNCSFGAQNVLHHIDVVECQSLTIDACEVEASGNSTVVATFLIKLGDNAAGKSVDGFQISGCRFLANSKANNAIRFDNVNGGTVTGNKFINTFLSGAYISNANATSVTMLGNDYGGGNPVSSVTGLEVFLSAAGQVTFGNGVTLNSGPTYTVTNPSTDRAFDVSTATLGELRAVVGTLIADLKNTSLIN